MTEQATVLYSWSEDGFPERCTIHAERCENAECTHCLTPIRDAGIVLESLDGDMYILHLLCALKACAGFDQPTIYRAIRKIDAAPLNEQVHIQQQGSLLVSADGQRQWKRKGEPEEDWWVEIDSHGKELAGEWEYDRETNTAICSLG